MSGRPSLSEDVIHSIYILLDSGLTCKEVSDKLCIGEATVKRYSVKYKKVNVNPFDSKSAFEKYIASEIHKNPLKQGSNFAVRANLDNIEITQTNFGVLKGDLSDLSDKMNFDTGFFPSDFEVLSDFSPKKRDNLQVLNNINKIYQYKDEYNKNGLFWGDSDVALNRLSSVLGSCCSFLDFKTGVLDDFTVTDYTRLNKAYFCKNRFCPICSWRRSLKIYSQLSQVIDFLGDDYRYLFITLTLKNCELWKLKETLQQISKAFNCLSSNKIFKKAVKGYLKTLEITYNRILDTFHPHLHLLCAVKPLYFSLKEDYLTAEYISHLWGLALGVEYLPSVKMEAVPEVDYKVKGEMSKSNLNPYQGIQDYVAGVSKFNFLTVSPRVLGYYFFGISSHTRFCSWGGVMNEARKDLQLDDVDNGDLLHVSDEEVVQFNYWLLTQYDFLEGSYKRDLSQCIVDNDMNVIKYI